MNVDELRKSLSYNADTGVFRWKRLPPNASNAKVGEIAGCIETPGLYRRIRVNGQRYVAHRLAWLYVYGEWPKGKLDHKDGNPDNNAISNLRLASPHQNSANRKCHENNFLGIKGVRLHETGRYHARIFVKGRHKSLGLHDTAEQAAEAYKQAAISVFGEFARFK